MVAFRIFRGSFHLSNAISDTPSQPICIPGCLFVHSCACLLKGCQPAPTLFWQGTSLHPLREPLGLLPGSRYIPDLRRQTSHLLSLWEFFQREALQPAAEQRPLFERSWL